jgi:hypothetical protein
MFDLEAAITDWKQSLAGHESLSPDDIAELETHLRDGVSSRNAMRLSEVEAFLIVRRRIGQPSDLDAEFAKEPSLTRWAHRGKWMCIGILALIFVRSAGGFLFQVVRLIGLPSEVDPMTLTIIYNMPAILFSWSIVLVGLFVVLRHAALLDRIVQRFARIPKSVLIGLPVAAITALGGLMLFNLYMTRSYGYTAFRLSFLAYEMSPPILFLVAVYVLHRSGQRQVLA